MTASDILVEVSALSVGFTTRTGKPLAILRDVSLAVRRGETIGVVGESGSGKSTLALAMMGYLKPGLEVQGGRTAFRDRDTFALTVRELEAIRGGDIALIPQNAGQSLTPTMRVGAQIEEALRLHTRLAGPECRRRAIELLRRVRLPDPERLLSRYPHELSGGQQQRVAVAMALAGEPNVLLLDEPTTGLDVTTQAHVLALLRDIARTAGTAMVYVSHDLGAIAQVCDRVAVMYAGQIVLEGDTRRVLRAPAHPYARGLLASVPRLDRPELPQAMAGRPPAPGGVGAGCAFAERCPIAVASCRTEMPPARRLPAGEIVRCHRAEMLGIDAADRASQAPPPVRRKGERHAADTPLLAIRGLTISYARGGVLDQLIGRAPGEVPTVADVAFSVRRGETVGLVGESGNGKSTILKAIAGLVAPRDGRMALEGTEFEGSVARRAAAQLRRIQLVFQNPDASLNPRHTIGEILAQPLRLYHRLDAGECRARSIALLDRVRLGAHYLDRLPGQLSGGEKQRVAIARAFAAEPEVVLCDEVTSALDVSVQAAVLELLDELRRERQVGYLFVSHDLAVVRAIADRVVVLYQGRVCEEGPVERVYAAPSHPYTEMLLGAVLEPDPDTTPRLLGEDVVERAPPATGCPFQRRCLRRVGDVCEKIAPPAQDDGNGHVIRCHVPRDALAASQAREA